MIQKTSGALGPWPDDPHFCTVFVLVLSETVLVLVLDHPKASSTSTSTILRIEYEYESRGNQLQPEIVGDARPPPLVWEHGGRAMPGALRPSAHRCVFQVDSINGPVSGRAPATCLGTWWSRYARCLTALGSPLCFPSRLNQQAGKRPGPRHLFGNMVVALCPVPYGPRLTVVFSMSTQSTGR